MRASETVADNHLIFDHAVYDTEMPVMPLFFTGFIPWSGVKIPRANNNL
jgi:hypothetical protein